MSAASSAPLRLARLCASLVLLGLSLGPAAPASASPEAPEASAPSFDVRPPAAWVRKLSIEARDEHPTGGSQGGVRYPLMDIQTRVSARTLERYGHYTRQVLNEGGISDAAEISVSFDPTYERLTLHGVWLHRGSERLDVFEPAAVKVIQQEHELAQRLYNGTLSALIFVRDVRVGDTLEYAYTVEGRNPVFGDRFTGGLYTSHSVAVGHMYQRLLWPRKRTLHVKNHGTDLQPTVKDSGEEREYVWEQRDVPALDIDDALPPWYEPWPTIQLSEYESWRDVARWAVPLYQPPSPLPPALAKEVERLRSEHPTPSARLLAALRFVQDHVRYLGLELGPNSHRPHAPEEVLAQRFGDCKDKSLLLVTLLRGLGIEARTALVNTELQRTLDTRLPSPGVFDHVIVQVRLDGEEYWMDPTATLERGPLSEQRTQPYGRALLIDESTEALTPIPAPEAPEPTMELEEHYVEGAGKSGMGTTLTVTTRWRGQQANDMRRTLATTVLKDLERESLNYYARTDPGIRAMAPMTVADDPEHNVLTLVESYAINDFWKEGLRDFDGWSVVTYLKRPRIARRTMPLAVGHPVHVHHRVRFELNKSISLSGSNEGEVDGPAGHFEYEYQLENGGRLLQLDFRYQSVADAVEPARLTEHLDALDQMHAHLGFQVARDGGGRDMRAMAAFLWPWLVGGLGVGALFIFLGSNPRGRLAELRAWRRKRAFSRKFETGAGETPSQAIVLATEAEVPSEAARLRCECGASGSAEAHPLRTEELVLGEQRLMVAKWNCVRCGRARHAYFAKSGARAA
ncbi:transglutaminase superfamily protein [Archangium gephyra]|uniref:Transglutaminase superfamily protein n=1 Tax=Archangium gephyra TaxID=48 RepID=A0ABX9K2S2_9BACT|nr:DUF3857 domain-containing protein [Archangium gephyra]REG32056.1 transglutaminase superfamily protein [Archangium gephyra]